MVFSCKLYYIARELVFGQQCHAVLAVCNNTFGTLGGVQSVMNIEIPLVFTEMHWASELPDIVIIACRFAQERIRMHLLGSRFRKRSYKH